MQQLSYHDFPYRPLAAGFEHPQSSPSSKAFIRLFHAAPDLSELAVYVNRNEVLKKMPYSHLTAYMEWDGGIYENRKCSSWPQKKESSSCMMIKRSEIYTYVSQVLMQVFALLDKSGQRPCDSTRGPVALTFVHLSPDFLPLIYI
ncbi:DUF4397 domain-containing protein [Bacillus pumilus]|nr:DUF4397 domain-containing protein [Bacillus pumilus]